jgi:tetratricopeptide (TPR) repeat protein
MIIFRLPQHAFFAAILMAPLSSISSYAQTGQEKTVPNRLLLDNRYAQVVALLNGGKIEEASAQIDRLLKDYPNHIPSLVLRGQLSERARDYSTAQQAYEKALKLVPKDPQILYLLGSHWLLRQDWVKSIQFLNESLKSNPLNPEALANLVRAYQRGGDRQKAVETLRRSVKLFPKDAAFCQQLGLSLCAEGLFPEGLQWLLKAEQLDPKLDKLNGQIGSVYHRRREAVQAISYLEKELQKRPGDPEISSMLGDDYSQLTNWEKARSYYLQALSGGRRDALTLYGLGRALLGLGNPQAAIEPLKQALRVDLKLVEVHFQLSRAYRALGREEEAAHEQAVFQVLNDRMHAPPPGKPVLAPQEAEFKMKCKKLLEDNREAEALQLLDTASSLPALSRAQKYGQVGEIYFSLNRFDDARRMLIQTLNLDPKLFSAHACLGATYASLGNLEKAEEAFNSALALDPSHPVARLGLGQIKYRQGQWREAANNFNKAQINDPFLLYMICDSHFHLGEKSEALVAVELFALFYSGDKELLDAMVRLLKSQSQFEFAERLSRLAP